LLIERIRSTTAFEKIDRLVRVDNGLSLTPIADARGNVCLLEVRAARVGQKQSSAGGAKLFGGVVCGDRYASPFPGAPSPPIDIMIDRRHFIRAAGAGIVMVALATEAQQTARLPRIGVLLAGNTGTGTEALREGFRERGYAEGRGAIIEWRWWEGKPERLRDAAAEMVRFNPDVIVVGGSEAAKAMKEATRSIPIVFIGPSYPVEEGLVQSFARPGGNITGITVANSDHIAKMLQLLLDIAPSLSHVGIIWSPANPGHTFILRDTETAARGMKLKVLPVAMTNDSDVDSALAAIAHARPGALILLATGFLNTDESISAARIGELAIRLRIPSITASKALMERGLLMSYGADARDVLRRIPSYVDRILKGAKPADMPVERPTKFELAINMKTAKALGLTIPQSLLLRADELIK
jgi:putative tryptophan/tyrosine transport system substrate-binding protein